MVRVFHCKTNCLKIMLMNQIDDFRGGIIRHEEIGVVVIQNPEQFGVVNI